MVDFQWHPTKPWTIASISDEYERDGGGAIQIWDILCLIVESEIPSLYNPE